MKPSVLLALLLSPAALAQSVRFRGQVEDVSGTANQFVVDCTNVRLTSSALNLNALVGQQVVIEGTWNGDFANPSVAVSAATPTNEDFQIGGNAKIGQSARLEVVGTPGESVSVFGAPSSGFFPLPLAGAVLIDPATAEFLGGGTIPGAGLLQIDSPIPNEPALVGLVYHAQAIVFSAGGVRMTTNDCKQISN